MADTYTDSAGIIRDAGPAQGAAGFDASKPLKVIQPDLTNSRLLDLSAVGNAVSIPIDNGQGVLGVDVTGLTGAGAVVVCEMRVGQSWRPSNMLVNGSGGAFSQSINADSQFRSSAAAKEEARIRVVTAGMGSATIAWSVSTNSSLVQLTAPLPAGNNKLGSLDVANFPAKTTVAFDGAQPVSLPSGASVAVSNFPATQPVSGTVNVGNLPASQAVTGTFWQATQPISAASLPLPAGAATAAKQDAIVSAIGARLQVNDYRLPNADAAGGLVPKVATGVSALIGSAAPCNFFGAVVIARTDGVGAYVFLLNRTTIPASGSTINMAEVLAMTGYSAGGGASLVPDQVPDRYSVGCVLIVSTSIDTYTPVTGANLPKYIKMRVL